MLHDYRYANASRYRNVPEAGVVQFLCCPFELYAGRAREETASMERLLRGLVAQGLPFREDGAGRRYDLAEVVNFIKYAHHAMGDPTWLNRSVATMRRLALGQTADAASLRPPDLDEVRAPPYAVTITRRFAPGVLRRGSVLRLNMPKPLNVDAGAHEVSWIRMDGAVAPPVEEPARWCVKVRAEGPGETVIALRHVFTPAARPTIAGADAQDAARHLRPREGLIVVTDQVRTLAARLGLVAAAPEISMRRIWDYLFDEMSFGFVQYERITAEDPLAWGFQHRRADCRTGSALIAALCRAAAIPARLVSGYTLHPALATSHTWVEVWMGDQGWAPFDTYAIDLAGGARDSPWRSHLFGRTEPRFIAEILPLRFCGLGAPRLPRAWQLSMARTEEGSTTWFHDVETFEVVYSESVSVAIAGGS